MNDREETYDIKLFGQDAVALWLKGKDKWNEWAKPLIEEGKKAYIDFNNFDFFALKDKWKGYVSDWPLQGYHFPSGTIIFRNANFGPDEICFAHCVFNEGTVIFDECTFKETNNVKIMGKTIPQLNEHRNALLNFISMQSKETFFCFAVLICQNVHLHFLTLNSMAGVLIFEARKKLVVLLVLLVLSYQMRT